MFSARVLGLGSVLPMVLTATACSGAPAHETDYVLVPPGRVDCDLPDGPVGVAASTRANAPVPEVTPAVAAVLQHAVDTEQYVVLFDTDGTPNKVAELALESRAKNSQARQVEVSAQSQQLQVGLQSGQANDREADPLEALTSAARSVRARSDQGTIVLIDSGLQTSGALPYQSKGLLLASGPDVVSHLSSTGQLPDLQGMTVVLSGIGDTATPQARLDSASRSRLIEQWSAIVEAGGASCVYLDPHPMTDTADADLPRVSEVVVPALRQPKLDLRSPVALREDSVGFEDNSATLRDAGLARQVLKRVAQVIVREDHHVLLVGTTATAGTERGRRELSLMRAQAVKGLLVDLGVKPTRISTRGVGTNHPEHVRDLDAKGAPIPEAAIQNRAVFLSVTRG